MTKSMLQCFPNWNAARSELSGVGWVEAQRKPSTRLLGFHFVPSQPTALAAALLLEILAPLVREISWRYSQIWQTVSAKPESLIRKLPTGELRRGRVGGSE